MELFPPSTPSARRTFVELGASDGKTLSNTYALEACAGWTGVCIEPTDAYDALFASGRDGCVKVRKAVAGTAREAVLIGSDRAEKDLGGEGELEVGGTLWAGLEEHFDEKSEVAPGVRDAHSATVRSAGSRTAVRTATLAAVLDGAGAPRHVDFLSLDVEGAELEILRSFPFNSRSFGAMVVEHSYHEATREEVRRGKVGGETAVILIAVTIHTGFH